jgi:carbonic anhydrase/acetyltransferase-like protein (isoleucine patch superfamily)
MFRGIPGKQPDCGRDVYVADSAEIIGDVIIGDDSSVWFGSVVRGDISPVRIGERTNIQDRCVIHVAGNNQTPMVIGSDVTIGHGAIIHACIVNDRVLVGMGAIILDGAEIGSDSIVGAGSLVTKGSVFPSGSVIMGSPAKVIRKAEEKDFELIRHSCGHYLELRALYPDFRIRGRDDSEVESK